MAWNDFLSLHEKDASLPMPMLHQMQGEASGGKLILRPSTSVALQSARDSLRQLEGAVEAWAGRRMEIVFLEPEVPPTEAESREQLKNDPAILKMQDAFGASLLHVNSNQ